MDLEKLGLTEEQQNQLARRLSLNKRHTSSFSNVGGISPRNFANAARRISKFVPIPPGEMKEIKINF
jgi:hypothetical protein